MAFNLRRAQQLRFPDPMKEADSVTSKNHSFSPYTSLLLGEIHACEAHIRAWMSAEVVAGVARTEFLTEAENVMTEANDEASLILAEANTTLMERDG